MEGEIAKRIIIESVNFQDMDTLEPVISKTQRQPWSANSLLDWEFNITGKLG